MSAAPDDDCFTCGEDPANTVYPLRECLNGQRSCGHHCNHLWDMDICHWCGAGCDEEGGIVAPKYLIHAHGVERDGMLTGLCGANHKSTGRPTFCFDDVNCPICLALRSIEGAP